MTVKHSGDANISRVMGNVIYEKINRVILVLGKRLKDNALTAEGRSRVDALPELLSHFDLNETALIFCGGVLEGQRCSEARAMAERFASRCAMKLAQALPAEHCLLEDQSTNTIENIQNAAHQLAQYGLTHAKNPIEIVLVSNDYHLDRIVEIQKMLPQQGLLSVLKRRCQQAGLDVSISLNVDDHCSVPYPHSGQQARAFLLLDELTTYRVYLEGVLNGVLGTDLQQVRGAPYQVAIDALSELIALDCCQGSLRQINRLIAIVNATPPQCTPAMMNPLYTEFNHVLTQLNRQFDPEN